MKKLLVGLLSLLLPSLAMPQVGTPISQLPNTAVIGGEFIPVSQPSGPGACIGIQVIAGFCGAYITPTQLKAFTGGGGGGSGNVSSTGSPSANALAVWSGANTITNGNLSGDCTTASTTVTTCLKTNGVPFVASATIDTTNAANISSGLLPNARLNNPITASTSGNAATATALAATPTQCTGGQFATGVAASGNANCGTPAGSGNVSTSGTITTGGLASWASGTTIQTATIGGDCTTPSNSTTITCTKTNGTAFGTFATANAATPPAIGGTTPAAGSFSTINGYTAPPLASPVGALGYLGVPVVSHGGAYTFALADAGTVQLNTDTSANTFTIPANGSVAFPTSNNNCIIIANAPTGGTLTVAITTDVLDWSQNGTTVVTGSRTLAPYGFMTICKIYDSTHWSVIAWVGMT